MHLTHAEKDTFCNRKYRSMLITGTFTMSVNYLMQLCDSIIAGLVISPNAVAAINLITPLTGMVLFLAGCITEGLATLYSRAVGAADKKRADELYSLGMIATVFLVVVIPETLNLIREPYFAASGMSGAILDSAGEYYRLLPVCSIFIILCSYLEAMVFADGDEQLQTMCYVAQIGGNIGLSIILAFHMGIFGIMVGTVIGYVLAILVLLIHFFKKSNTLHFVPHFSWKDLGICFRYSVVDVITYPLWGLVNFILISFISRNYDEKYLIVLAVAISLINFSVVYDGIGMAMQPLISVYFGEKNHFLIRRLMKSAEKTAIIEGIISTVLIFIAAPLFARLFGVEDESLMLPAVEAIRIICLTLTSMALFNLMTSYYLYTDRVGFSIMTVCITDGPMYTVFPILFALLFGANGLWIGFAVAPVVGLVLSMFIFRLRKGKERFPLYLDWMDSRIIVFDSVLEKEKLPEISQKIQKDLSEQGYDNKTAIKAALFTEEIGTTLLEQNGDNKVWVEYSLLYDKDRVSLIIRDSGKIFDVTDPDIQIKGLSSFVITGLLIVQKEKDYIPTTGYNRNIIRFNKTNQ